MARHTVTAPPSSGSNARNSGNSVRGGSNANEASSGAEAALTPATLPADGLSRWSDLKPFIPLSRETIRQRELAGRFPRHQKITQRCTVWPNREIHRWLTDPVNYRASNIIGGAA